MDGEGWGCCLVVSEGDGCHAGESLEVFIEEGWVGEVHRGSWAWMLK